MGVNLDVSGIYKIENNVNGKIYIGSSINIKSRFQKHKSQLRGNYHDNRHLQNAWNKHGEESFLFQVIEVAEVAEVAEEEGRELLVKTLLEREQFWLDKTKCYYKNYGYNLSKISNGNSNHNVTSEMRMKMSIKAKGRKHSKESIEKIRKSHIGLYHTEDTKEMLRRINVGKKHSEETKRKMSESHKGKKRSYEARENMSKAQMSITHKKLKLNEEQVREVKKLLKDGDLSQRKIAEIYKVSQSVIFSIKHGKTWSNIEV